MLALFPVRADTESLTFATGYSLLHTHKAHVKADLGVRVRIIPLRPGVQILILFRIFIPPPRHRFRMRSTLEDLAEKTLVFLLFECLQPHLCEYTNKPILGATKHSTNVANLLYSCVLP